MSKEQLETGQIYLMKLEKDTEANSCSYVKIIAFPGFIEAIYDQVDMVDHPKFNDEVWLLFSGDKGVGIV